MDMDRGNFSSERKDLKTQGSWIPVTPVKPVLDIPESSAASPQIDLFRDKNLVRLENFRTSWLDPNRGGADILEAALAEKVQVSGNNDHLTRSNNIPFVKLSTEAAGGSSTTAQAGYLAPNGAHDFCFNVKSTSFLTTNGPSLGLNQKRTDANRSPQMAPCEVPFDLNVLPAGIITDKQPSSTIIQFAPITPDKLTNQANQNTNDGATIQAGISNVHHEKTFSSSDALSPALSTVEADNPNPENSCVNVTPQVKTRRRKHRPRVITEGKPRWIRKPSMPMDDHLKESSTGKRNYVRNKGLDNCPTTPPEVARNIFYPTAEIKTRSAKRALDFECNGKLEYESPEWNSTNGYPELQVGSKRTGTTYVNTMNIQLDDYLSLHTAQPASTSCPNNANTPCEKLNPHNQLLQSDGRIFNSDIAANCSTASTIEVGETIVKKRRCAEILGMQDPNLHGSNGLNETFHVQVFSNRTSGTLVPQVYKRRRTELSTSNTSSSVKTAKVIDSLVKERLKSQSNASNVGLKKANFSTCSPQLLTNKPQITQAETLRVVATDRVQGFECMLALGNKERLTKKRSKAPTRVCNLAPLIGLSERKMLPALPGRQALLNGDARRVEVSHVPQNCIEALVADTRAPVIRRKRSKKQVSFSRTTVEICQNNSIYTQQNVFTDPKGLPPESLNHLLSVDAITERLKHLDIMEKNIISYQKSRAVVPYTARYQPQNELLTPHMKKQGKNALVVYQSDGTTIPFGGPFYPIKKRRPRPKVDLDEETNKVWRLLLENINSKGVDGTEEQKEKWWEEERKVFRGRADSFIARMHLVQGDRRFSKWKGSVLDSVIGVFLTQNVSDHLSSSAFMSMASHFPLQSKTRQCYEESHPVVEEPDLCLHDLEDNIKWKEKTPDNIVCEQSSITQIEPEYNHKKEVDNRNESYGSSKGPLSSNDAIKSILHSFRSESSDLECYHEITINKSTTQQSVREASYFLSDRVSVEDVISSQISIDSSIAQTIIVEQYSGSNSEVQDVAIGVREQSGVSQDMVKLANNSQAATNDRGRSVGERDIIDSPAHIIDSPAHERDNDLQQNNVSNFSGEISDVSESTIMCKYQKKTENNGAETNPKECNYASMRDSKVTNDYILTEMRKGVRKEKAVAVDWDSLRKQAQANGIRERTPDTMDSLDWEAVRCADVGEIAHTIRERGMNNMLAERIKDFLNRLVQEHGSLDLEWLRDVPPDKAKAYLLSVRGLGLKSVECVRLLTLHHLAFPVDTNVGRIAVRLGWVPLQPLPESLQLHLLELYPVLESIQKYLWPRLCKLDQRTLYELHYQMITFGKVFCTKTKPNCNACPMRGECRHFASAFASARLALPAPEEKSIVSATNNRADGNIPIIVSERLQLPSSQVNQHIVDNHQSETIQPSETEYGMSNNEPIIEEPATPEPECIQITECDIEDACSQDLDEIPTIKLDLEEFTQTLQDYMQKNMDLREGDMSRALVALGPEAASIPMPKLKYISRLRTEHQVYELPDSHPLLHGLDKREPDDPCFYLLAIWTPGETTNSIQPPQGTCDSQGVGKLCSEMTCFSCNSIREANSQTVRGTLLLPCRTAMRGSFPLNGTYFQVNEVFADHDSSLNPIDVPRAWIWNLPRRTVYFGTSIPTIFKGLTTEGIQYCFWRGFVCVRGFDQKMRAPRPLITRLHFPASKMTQRNAKPNGHSPAHSAAQ